MKKKDGNKYKALCIVFAFSMLLLLAGACGSNSGSDDSLPTDDVVAVPTPYVPDFGVRMGEPDDTSSTEPIRVISNNDDSHEAERVNYDIENNEDDEDDYTDSDDNVTALILPVTLDLVWQRNVSGTPEILRADLIGLRYNSIVFLNPDARILVVGESYSVSNFTLSGRDAANYVLQLPNLRASELPPLSTSTQESPPPTPAPFPTPTLVPTPAPPRPEPPAPSPVTTPTTISCFREIYPAGTHVSVSGNARDYVQKIVNALYPNWRNNFDSWTGDAALRNMRVGNQVSFTDGTIGIILSVNSTAKTITITAANVNSRVVWDHVRNFDDIDTVSNWH
jgi:hypothetical protein